MQLLFEALIYAFYHAADQSTHGACQRAGLLGPITSGELEQVFFLLDFNAVVNFQSQCTFSAFNAKTLTLKGDLNSGRYFNRTICNS